MTRIDELLTNKEIKGLKIAFYFKLVILIFLISGSFSPGASMFEKTYGSGLCSVLILVTIILLFLLRKRRRITLIGVIGTIVDIILIGLLPIIWYFSVGGFDVSPAYLLKTPVPYVAIALMI